MRDGIKVIDIHNHFYSRPWLDYLAERSEEPRFEWTGPTSGVARIGEFTPSHVDKAGDFDIEARIRDLDDAGIDVQVLSHTCPGVAELPVAESIEWAKKINDIFADICKQFPGRFYFLATIPPRDIKEALKEMERASKELGAKGVQMYSNIDGVLATSEEFYPIFEKASEFDLSVKIHPSFKPLATDAMRKAGLPLQLYGFTLDTTMVLTTMLFQGLFERLPGLKVIHSHLGGMAPYMMGRVDTAFKRYAKEINIKGSRPPSEVYKEHVYIDTLSMHVPAIKCAWEYMGVDRLLFGTDYPHRASGTVEGNLAVLDQVGFPKEDKQKVLSGNATRLFRLE
ncbi:MAG: amidohydrolase [Deltaproteobacteria bacterium]|nr:amidohydrolase [Deltaproteobacteria bacterium]MBW2066334.1 amidohydrolase [Deltaproteobacteria bacterium]